MLFNSIEFAFFLPFVFFVYWFVSNNKRITQNIFVLIASYFFYGWWDCRFLLLIIVSSLLDFQIGKLIFNSTDKKKRKNLLLISLLLNLGILGVFKYFNFFVENFIAAFSFLGLQLHETTLNVLLPVGISFYTFQTLSYSIDVYRNKIEPCHEIISFMAFVSFFPQLVAGPIERASQLLPQFQNKRVFDYEQATDGLRQMLWGFFKKLVIADNAAVYADYIFENPEQHSGITLIMGAVFFALQIYGDFSGYSDIAIGTARLFGFNLSRNFAYPYFSRNIAEFWRRWHISLTTWFRDYVYIPMGGSRAKKQIVIRNTFVIFIISGFWHGANWTFIIWGIFHAILFIPSLLTDQNRKYMNTVAENRIFPSPKEFFQILATFSITTFAWIFFRAENLSHAMLYISGIFDTDFLRFETLAADSAISYKSLAFFIIIMFLMEWFQRNKQHGLQFSRNQGSNKFVRWFSYYAIGYIILIFGNFAQTEFIYFAF